MGCGGGFELSELLGRGVKEIVGRKREGSSRITRTVLRRSLSRGQGFLGSSQKGFIVLREGGRSCSWPLINRSL
jgi:hypothetical protein